MVNEWTYIYMLCDMIINDIGIIYYIYIMPVYYYY